ncbi:hypothetical protein BJ741DRAFT_699434 [Chytriomyces cf. hyalinus JEL632]|nr:hypothetical protein BJ741DRAFT_699434 [Chytriomyces cf. hyalinus JEL632]
MWAILGALPERIEVFVDHAKSPTSANEFFDALYHTKKVIIRLDIGTNYSHRCDSDLALVDMTVNWLAKLPIHEFQFMTFLSIPAEILGVLHLAPLLGSLHLQNVQDCDHVALSECKSLWELSFTELFDDGESPERIAQRLVRVLKGTKIELLKMSLRGGWEEEIPSDFMNFVAVLLQHGLHKQPGPPGYFVCRKLE